MTIKLNPGETKRIDAKLQPVVPDTARLHGYVKDANTGKAIYDVRVTIAGPLKYDVWTDSAGYYDIQNIEPGYYAGITYHPDYESFHF